MIKYWRSRARVFFADQLGPMHSSVCQTAYLHFFCRFEICTINRKLIFFLYVQLCGGNASMFSVSSLFCQIVPALLDGTVYEDHEATTSPLPFSRMSHWWRWNGKLTLRADWLRLGRTEFVKLYIFCYKKKRLNLNSFLYRTRNELQHG